MRRTSSRKWIGICAAGIAVWSVGEARAQLVKAPPVGGTLAIRSDGRLIAAIRGPDNRVNVALRAAPGSGTAQQLTGWSQWDAWEHVGTSVYPDNTELGTLSTSPTLIANTDDSMLIAGCDPSNRLIAVEEWRSGSGDFGWWAQASTRPCQGRPALLRRHGGPVEMYFTDSSGVVWTATQASVRGAWSSWSSPLARPSGTSLRGSPVVAVWGSVSNGTISYGSTVYLFSTGGNNHLYVTSQTAGGSWAAWTDLGGAVGPNDAVAAGTNGNGLPTVFVNNTSGTVSFRTRTSTGWTNWATAPGSGTSFTRPSVANHNDGRLALFFDLGSGANASTSWQSQTAVSGAGWSSWAAFQSPVTSPPVAITDNNGIMHVLLLGAGGAVYERVQTARNATTWTTVSIGYLGLGPFPAF